MNSKQKEGLSTTSDRFRALAGAMGVVVATLWVGLALPGLAQSAAGSTPASAPRAEPYLMEWVYRVRWGHDAEFWRIFQRTQIPVLEQEKKLGNVLEYHVYKPGLHAAGTSRWTYRVVIAYRDATGPGKAGAIERALFPDRAAYEREETKRWDLVEDHYDLPIREIDPTAEP